MDGIKWDNLISLNHKILIIFKIKIKCFDHESKISNYQWLIFFGR